MSNPFNKPEFRNEAVLGDAYRTVREVHEHLDELLLLASRFHEVRSGNIELSVDENWKLKYKYVRGSEWFEIGDLTDLVNIATASIPAMEIKITTLTNKNTAQDTKINENVTAISSTNTALSTESNKVSALQTLTQTHTDTIAAMQLLITAQGDAITALTLRVQALEEAAP